MKMTTRNTIATYYNYDNDYIEAIEFVEDEIIYFINHDKHKIDFYIDSIKNMCIDILDYILYDSKSNLEIDDLYITLFNEEEEELEEILKWLKQRHSIEKVDMLLNALGYHVEYFLDKQFFSPIHDTYFSYENWKSYETLERAILWGKLAILEEDEIVSIHKAIDGEVVDFDIWSSKQ